MPFRHGGTFATVVLFGILSSCASPRTAQTVSADSAAVVTAVQSFHSALAEGDSATVLDLLGTDARIVESGGIETRAEYRSGHMLGDMRFASAVSREAGPILVVVVGDVAWATSTSVTQGRIARQNHRFSGGRVDGLDTRGRRVESPSRSLVLSIKNSAPYPLM